MSGPRFGHLLGLLLLSGCLLCGCCVKNGYASAVPSYAEMRDAWAAVQVDKWSMSAAVTNLFLPRAADVDETVTYDCPATCSEGEAWCQKQFGRGGVVTLGARCGSGAFECVCNDILTIEVSVTNVTTALECRWSDRFDIYPDGAYCYAITGVGPSACTDIAPELCDWNSTCRQDTVTGIVNYSCATCDGAVYTIVGTTTNFTRAMTDAPSTCVPATTCRGHGCCTPSGTCSCYLDPITGFWSGATCDVCADGYQGSECRAQIPTIQILLSGIARTWTMVAPNMAVLFLFVVFGLARRLWESDRTFQLTRLRRANLSPVQVARRGQQGLFRSKYIPRRPAKSRSFAKDEKPEMRGPPAY